MLQIMNTMLDAVPKTINFEKQYAAAVTILRLALTKNDSGKPIPIKSSYIPSLCIW